MKTKVIGNVWICGRRFEKLRPQPSIQPKYACLLDAYNNPSAEKRNVWYYWMNFIDVLGDELHVELRWNNVGVYSRNTMKYTICFRFSEWGIQYQCLITPTHNYIWEIKEGN